MRNIRRISFRQLNGEWCDIDIIIPRNIQNVEKYIDEYLAEYFSYSEWKFIEKEKPLWQD